MSSVVLRCSNCGTVQAGTGECEACHEAKVGYFCTNHTPGLWLDTPACPQCGARFGEAAPAPRATRPEAHRAAPEPDDGPRARDTMPSRLPDGAIPDGLRRPAAGILLEALAHAARARSMRKARIDDAADVSVRAPGSGCVRRMVLLALLLAALFVFIPLLLGGALLQMF